MLYYSAAAYKNNDYELYTLQTNRLNVHTFLYIQDLLNILSWRILLFSLFKLAVELVLYTLHNT